MVAHHDKPLDRRQQQYFFSGVGLVVVLVLVIRMGWNDVEWLQNPLKALAYILLGAHPNSEMEAGHWLVGGIVTLLLVIVLGKTYRQLRSDFLGRSFVIAVILGLFAADASWALLAMSLVLYFGLPILLPQQASPAYGFLRQRGVPFLLVFILCNFFMRADKEHYDLRNTGILSAQDQLIKTFADETEIAHKASAESGKQPAEAPIRVASQWPSRTMIACRCDTLPLPPVAPDPKSQLTMLKSITNLILDPKQPNNLGLAENFANLGGVLETTSMQPGGVILQVKGEAALAGAGGQ
jgi:hypothetical protein